MRNSFGWFLAIVVLLAVGGNGCSRSSRSKDLATLDQAYESGVLNKDEYEAKKAGLESQSESLAALDKALATGAITPADYQTTKAQLIAKSSALAALEKSRQAGVFTQDQYLAKRAALMGAGAAVALAAALADSNQPTPAGSAAEPARSASSNGISFTLQNGMKTLNAPQGGRIFYGPVAGQTTEAGAMGAVLRSLHEQLGERPQVGKLFQVRGTQSVAAFFSVGE